MHLPPGLKLNILALQGKQQVCVVNPETIPDLLDLLW